MKKVVLLFVAPLLFVASQVRAEGAYAVAIPEGGLRDGFAYGLSTNYRTREEAEQGAIAECRKQAIRFDVPESRCKVIETFQKQCLSIAFDRKDRWVGWAIAASREQAAADAIKKCSEGAKNCATSNTDCDR